MIHGRVSRLNDNEDVFINLNPNPLVRHLGKLPKEFTKEDIVKFAKDREVKMINLCHVAEDCRLKTLSFAINNEAHLNEILDFGERVDGSSLFSFLEPSKSDVHIKPRINKTFVNPFNIVPTLNVLCDYFGEDGEPLEISPANVLRKAQERLLKETGIAIKVLCELEFYIIAKRETSTIYPGTPQKNYQESSPFAKFEHLRNEMLTTLAAVGVSVKYGHAEVGMIENDNALMEQHEIEPRLETPVDMADNVSIAKWIIRNVAAKYGVEASFAPKIVLGHAGNGMHVHISGARNDEIIMTNSRGELSEEARAMIGGVLKFAPSLTAFGNTVPTSYLRLVPKQEAPTKVYWGYKNREALIRVPLGWWTEENGKREYMQTFELRLPDGSANVYLLLAGILMAIGYGLTHKEKALEISDETLAESPRFSEDNLKILPRSCYESAKLLEKHREIYEKGNVFPKRMIDGIVKRLKLYDDENLVESIKNDNKQTEELIKKHLHCG
ncbi:glutamine synthetase [Candidatus Bathyarchaeota archaeon A05DMB-4]|jgi:glutamine synthetase|nr:glutamine synthetase [Candidatus Bathyarchaeota archaeon A05DMB-4]